MDDRPFADMAESARLVAMAALPQGLAAAARAVIALAEARLADGVGEWGDKLNGLACKAGCSHCCYQAVGVTPAEAAELERATS